MSKIRTNQLETLNGLVTVDVADLGTSVSARRFGVVGDYVTDDTAAINAARDFSIATGVFIDFADMVCRYTGTLVLVDPDGNGARFRGNGAPQIATFPQGAGDKRFLRPGLKHRLPGAAILFDGTGDTITYSTVRSDKFATVTPMVSAPEFGSYELSGIGLIQDMDVFDVGGSLTSASTDNRATAYDTGFFTRATISPNKGVTLFGYFPVQGLVVMNENDGPPPDYNSWAGCLISSGVANLGNDLSAVTTNLTGTRFTDCGIYGADHHTRADGFYTVNVVYCDGNTASGGLRGLTFSSCNLRGYANDFLSFDHCNDVQFLGCTFESPALSGVSDADINGVIVGTSNTGDIRLIGGASTHGMGVPAFAQQISGKLIVAGCGGLDSIMISQSGGGVRITGSGATGDSIIQLTDDFSSVTTGWVIQRDESISDELSFKYNNASVFGLYTDGSFSRGLGQSLGVTQTISAGAVSRSSSNYFPVDTEASAASDTLETIEDGDFDGQIITIRCQVSSRTVTVAHSVGNIRCGTDFTLAHPLDRMVLQWNGNFWVEISRSSNS